MTEVVHQLKSKIKAAGSSEVIKMVLFFFFCKIYLKKKNCFFLNQSRGNLGRCLSVREDNTSVVTPGVHHEMLHLWGERQMKWAKASTWLVKCLQEQAQGVWKKCVTKCIRVWGERGVQANLKVQRLRLGRECVIPLWDTRWRLSETQRWLKGGTAS